MPTDRPAKFELMFRLYAPDQGAVREDLDAVRTSRRSRRNRRRVSDENCNNAVPLVALRSFSRSPRKIIRRRPIRRAHSIPRMPDLPRSAGMPAQLANEAYVEALARVVYYWAYPAVDSFGRTNMWEIMKDGPGMMLGIAPGGPVNKTGCLADYLPPSQRIVVTPNNDTFYGATFVDLGREPVVIQTPDRRAERTLLDYPDRRRLHQRRPPARFGFGHPRRQVPARRARTGRVRSRRASSTCCACRPTWPAPFSAASRRAPRRRRRARSPCSTRSACIR